MRRILQSTILSLLLLVFPTPGSGAGEPYPQVRIVVRVKGPIFHDVSASDLAQLKSDVQSQVVKAATDNFPCMEWVTEEERRPRAGIGAWLFVDLSQRSYKDYRGLSWIDLSFSGAVENPKREVILWPTSGVFPVASSLYWSPRNLQGLKEKVFAAMATNFSKQELRGAFDSKFIASIPIAENIQVDAPVHEVIVPINAKRVNLMPETLLKLTLRASLCPLKPEECSKMGLMSEGAGDGNLRCRIESMDCCAPDWPPGFAERLERVKNNVKVFLSESHQHCPHGPGNCPGPDHLFRHRGTYP
jgi:hypothetical protein